jgi:hypothetical protein
MKYFGVLYLVIPNYTSDFIELGLGEKKFNPGYTILHNFCGRVLMFIPYCMLTSRQKMYFGVEWWN